MRHLSLFAATALLGTTGLVSADNRTVTQLGGAWQLTGNQPTSSAFLGTLNNQPLVLKAGGQEALRILPNGNVGIGTTTPAAPLEVIYSGGSAEISGHYGVAGNFVISNPLNTDPALRAGTVTPGGFAIYGTESIGGVGIDGDDETGPNDLLGKGIGVFGFSAFFTGVYGASGTGTDAPPGVYAAGVWGHSSAGTGVLGTSSTELGASSGYFVGGSDGIGTCRYGGGAGWSCSSDRNLKTDFAPVDSSALLDRLAQMPIFTYHFKQARDKALWLGPTAQDFAAAFQLGNGDDRFINTGNAQGVALAAAKGLYEKLKQDEAQIAADRAMMAADHAKIAALEARLARLEQTMGRPEQQASNTRRN